MSYRFLTAFVFCAIVMSAPVTPLLGTDGKQLQQKQTTISRQQKQLNQEIAKLQKQLIGIGRKTRDIEAKIGRIDARLGLIASQEHRQRKEIINANDTLGGTLTAMIQLADHPNRLFLLYPGDGLAAARSHLLVRYVTPKLQSRIQEINQDILALIETQNKLEDEKILLFDAQEDLAAHRVRIERLVAQKQQLLKVNKKTLTALAKETKALQAQSRNLNELVAKASKTQSRAKAGRTAKPDNIRRFPAKGKITLPAKGKIIRKFGQKTPFGANSRGLVLKTSGAIEILASFDGRVVFSGEFQNQGKMLIIEHRGDYHTVISGLGDLYAKRGQWVLEGEPIGRMSRHNLELYVELRKNGQHINPSRFIS